MVGFMPSDYATLCNDYYLNQRLMLKMDLHIRRDTVLSLFERVRRERPQMGRMRRYTNELALESNAEASDTSYQWMSVRRTSIRSGSVNHQKDADAHALHRLALETAPFFLDMSTLDIEYAEVLFGFDLLASGNHDSIVFNALLAGSPFAAICDRPGLIPTDCQPIFGMALREDGSVQAHIEIKTRTGGHGTGGGWGSGGRMRGRSLGNSGCEGATGAAGIGRGDEPVEYPLSLYLVLRRYGLSGDIRDLPSVYNTLVAHGEELLERRIVPNLLMPIREAIMSA